MEYASKFICMYINRSPPSSIGIKNAWSSTSTPFAFTVLCLIKHDLFYLYLPYSDMLSVYSFPVHMCLCSDCL